MDKINLPAALRTIAETWDPHVAGSVGDTHVRIARSEGAFDWHAHADEDEAFYVIRGSLTRATRRADCFHEVQNASSRRSR